jgi:hypothetical protein
MSDRPKIVTRVRRKLDQQGRVLSTTFDRLETLAQKPSPARARSIEAGKKNLANWRAGQAPRPIAATAKAATDAFRASLEAGTTQLSASQRILIEGACATFTALQMCVSKLQGARPSFERTLKLTAQVTSLQKALLKSVTALQEMSKSSTSPTEVASAELAQIETEIHSARTSS